MSAVLKGPDGLARCAWGLSTPDYVSYHDDEWGHPVADEGRIYEKLCLEGFQSGLSWLTILRKRENFRAAFSKFDPKKVAKFTDVDVEKLLQDSGIVRHRGKILATINNAKATMNLHAEGLTLAGLVWKYEPLRHKTLRGMADIQATTEESKALSKDLIKRGFKFVGPTTVYSAMQSLGVVNDHMSKCYCHAICEAERGAFARPFDQVST
ncbi:MAG: DNA-3-methyladenine glycosylase I [Acidimicrobiales bacterium]|jgi:DNA-3-methyladenine glycosylase I